ncbi:MAG: hypothetical protein QOI38_3129 [Sphingomonadales bacterium]|jgi:phage gp36-like protein|nr:hypothetical protein [Sphingomonadales bacterium]
MQRLIKQPAEELKRSLAFEGAAPIAAIISVAAESRGLVVGSAALVVSGELGAGMLFVRMEGGTDGERYLVTARVEDQGGEIREAELELAVVDGAWTMPAGGDGYLAIDEFVRMFGLEEAVRMTDDGTGRIDRAMLVEALSAVQAVADVHISAAYAVPLSPVPQIVKVAIADMARARLYPRGAPDGVADAAKAGLKLLERIGEKKLPLPSAAPLPEATSSSPILIAPGVRRYTRGLEDY